MVTKDDLAGLATKRDLEVLKQEVKEEVKEQVKEEVVKAVAPVRTEVQEVKDRVRKLEKGKGSGKSSEDFAFKRVEFKGFKKETSPTARLEAMNSSAQGTQALLLQLLATTTQVTTRTEC